MSASFAPMQQGFTPAIQTGVKYDEGKARYDLIPPVAMETLASTEDGPHADGRSAFNTLMSCAWTWWGCDVPLDFDQDHPMIGAAYAALCLYEMDQHPKTEAFSDGYFGLPPNALNELAKLYALGAKKYADRNWEKGMDWGRIFAALQRHANAWRRGEKNDPTDGQPHLISAAWCAIALFEYERRDIGTDNRPYQQRS